MRTVLTLLINLVLIGFLMSLIEGGSFSESFNTVLGWAIVVVIVNWLYGWVCVLRAEWAFRRPQPRDEGDGDPGSWELEMSEEERAAFEERKKRVKGRLIQSGQLTEEDLREQQARLRKELGGR